MGKLSLCGTELLLLDILSLLFPPSLWGHLPSFCHLDTQDLLRQYHVFRPLPNVLFFPQNSYVPGTVLFGALHFGAMQLIAMRNNPR